MPNSELLKKSVEALLHDTSIDAIIAIDKDNNIIAWNSAAEKIHQQARADVMGKSIFDVIPSFAMDDNSVKAITQANTGVKYFLPASKVYGHRTNMENHFIPLKEGEEIIGVMNLAHDVSQRIKAEEELQFLNDALSHKNRQLKTCNDELASLGNMASANLKEPLRKMYTAAEAIIQHDGAQLSDNGKANLRRIQSAVQRIGLITDDLLYFTELSQHAKPHDRINLNAVFLEATSNMKNFIDDKNALIDTTSLPNVNGNQQLLVQLFQNIIHNAIKFQPGHHRPFIKIASHHITKSDKSYLILSFKDNGIGFKQEHAQTIFNLFSRLHEPGSYPGNGMGLAIAKKIMEQHHGFIEASSMEGAGTGIFLFFPEE